MLMEALEQRLFSRTVRISLCTSDQVQHQQSNVTLKRGHVNLR
jgi:hypothetical protein